ncbi:MAG: stage III sporulation protein AA [Lachnospiraceae bacterium]|nr:stage III sporulation protein AA [Lachnospiraceae bacterium]
MDMQDSLYRILGQGRNPMWEQVTGQAGRIREIRLRINQPIIVRLDGEECYLDGRGRFTGNIQEAQKISGQELDEFFMHLCQGSPYAFEEMLRQGFLTVPGGHRVGFAGQVVTENGKTIRTIKHLYYVNIRIAHEVRGVADDILPHLYRNGELQNVLIISPPGHGKTTLLRELIRKVSDGNPYGRGRTVGVVDERSELAGAFLGCPQNELGIRTDVLEGCSKSQGMLMLLRSMTPEVLAVDELGDAGEAEALRAASVCGCKVLATVHGESWEDVRSRFPELFVFRVFEQGVLRKDRRLGSDGNGEDAGRDSDPVGKCGTWHVVPCPFYRKYSGETDIGGNSGAPDE